MLLLSETQWHACSPTVGCSIRFKRRLTEVMRRKCRIWWPHELSANEPTSSICLFGWFTSSSLSSLDVVVSFACDEVSFSPNQSGLQVYTKRAQVEYLNLAYFSWAYLSKSLCRSYGKTTLHLAKERSKQHKFKETMNQIPAGSIKYWPVQSGSLAFPVKYVYRTG